MFTAIKFEIVNTNFSIDFKTRGYTLLLIVTNYLPRYDTVNGENKKVLGK